MYRGEINSVKEIQSNWSIYDTVKYRRKETTVGRVIFNSLLPKGYPFINDTIDKKKLNEILLDIYKKYGVTEYIRTIQKISQAGFKYYTLSPKSVSINDLEPPPEILKLKKQLERAKTKEEFDSIYKEILRQLKTYLAKYGYDVYDIVNSGSRGNWRQIAQMLVSKGLVTDPQGNVYTIQSSISSGLKPTEFFISGMGARAGVVDRALNTSTSGYLTRRLVFACQSVLLGSTQDCKTSKCITVKVTKEIVNKIVGRYLKNKTIISEEYAEKLIGKVIELRSPIFCTSEKICRTCYGKLADIINTTNIGVLAAQSIGERGTQLIMRTFHLGGAVSYQATDVIDMLAKYNYTDKDNISNFFKQDKDKLIANVDISIIFSKQDYPNIGSITYNKENKTLLLQMIVGIAQPQDEKELRFIIDSAGEFNNVQDKQDHYLVEVKKNDVVVTLKTSTDRFLQSIQKAISLLEGRIPWKTPEDLLVKFFELYKNEGPDIDLVHYEVILSNLLRNKQNPYKPARLIEPYEPVLYGLKKVPYYDGSWLLGLSFENAGKAIQNGLIYGRLNKELTPIEKILLGVPEI